MDIYQALARLWNEYYPPGTPVAVIEGDGSVVESVTESQAWNLEQGSPIVRVRGKAGGYLLTRVLPLPEGPVEERLRRQRNKLLKERGEWRIREMGFRCCESCERWIEPEETVYGEDCDLCTTCASELEKEESAADGAA